MSWLLGFISKNGSSSMKTEVESLTPHSLFTIDSGKGGGLYLRSGGLKATCHFPVEKNGDSFWLALGSGIRLTDTGSSFFTDDDWREVLQQKNPALTEINGGFLLLRSTGGELEFFCDSIGFRTLYLAKTDHGVLFSTRLDWIAKIMPTSSIDISNIGARWLAFNQISYESPLKDVIRLGPLGYAKVTARSIRHTFTLWNPRQTKATIDDATSLAHRFLLVQGTSSDTMKIGISGGVDSRVLLSILLSKKIPFSAYTFGALDEPDVIIASRIARQEKFEHTVQYASLPRIDEFISLIDDYIGQANLNEPLTTLLRLRNISLMQKHGALMVDGAYGEVARRQYFNRIAVKGKKFLIEKNVERLIPFFMAHRADIFTDDIKKEMQNSVAHQVSDLLDTMPSVSDVGLESYLDLMAVRARIPNFGADEQARLDSIILNFMPFATLEYLNLAFSLPLSDRRDGKMFRRIIRRERPSLVHFPFVKLGASYPFWMTSVQSWIWARLKSKVGLVYNDNAQHDFLRTLKVYIIDTVNSDSVKQYSLYDYRKVRSLVLKYYDGRTDLGLDVNWWFTFDMWRRKMEK